jgi:signal transduction histidine kinase
VGPGLPAIATDRDELKRVLVNLLSNVVKDTDEGSNFAGYAHSRAGRQ